MKAAAALYTVASVAVLALMIMRPPVEVSSPVETSPAPETTNAAPPASQEPAETNTPMPTAPTPASTEPTAQQPVQMPAPAQAPLPAADTAVPAPTAVMPAPPDQAPTPMQMTAPAAVPPAPASPSPPPPEQAPTPMQMTAPATAAPASASPSPPQPEQAPAPASVTPPPDANQTAPAPAGEALPDEKKNDAGSVAKPAPTTNATPDYAREQRIASEIHDSILDGEVLTLNDGNHDFMGILTNAEQPRGAVIILHGRGVNPDWEDVAHPLRTGLATKGWTTLSLQMPVLEKDAKYYDYIPLFPNADKRIDAGIAFLKQKGIKPIVLAAHSCGAHMAMHWIENKGDGDIAAYVGLGMGATDYQQDMTQPFPLDKMQVPVLDVYGEKEYPQVISMAPERQALMQKAGNPNSKQMVLPVADHYFKDKGEELTAVVSTWLNSLPL
ncbi:MAG: DUF3530 family protein [Thiothrix sp.]